jgi:pimeloyl-ACP methyl ester carboxylesterase
MIRLWFNLSSNNAVRLIMTLILLFPAAVSKAQLNGNENFGNNATKGHYLQMNDQTKIYYEVYGDGRPLVLLHGGLFGDISEYEKLIPKLSKHFQVIAIETRGHGKSEIGNRPFTYSLMADDAFTIIKYMTKEPSIVIGFSDGAIVGITLAVTHPELVKKLVFAGGNLFSKGNSQEDIKEVKQITGTSIEKQYPDFVRERKKLMPQPQRWNDFVEMLKNAWLTEIKITSQQLKKVKCPVFVIGGDRDQYTSAEDCVASYRMLTNARLAIIPRSGHVVFETRPDLLEALVLSFALE